MLLILIEKLVQREFIQTEKHAGGNKNNDLVGTKTHKKCIKK